MQATAVHTLCGCHSLAQSQSHTGTCMPNAHHAAKNYAVQTTFALPLHLKRGSSVVSSTAKRKVASERYHIRTGVPSGIVCFTWLRIAWLKQM